MKFNFKKVASILASGAMLASTIGFAAAANYPAPFDSTGSAVVYGTNGASSDLAAAIDIYDQLKARSTTSVDASISGEAKAVETASQPLYLGDYMNSTKATFSKTELPTVLADGKVTDDDGKELDYELKIDVPTTYVKYGDTPDNFASPVIYADFDGAQFTYSLKLIFPTAVNTTKLTDESINLFGQNYAFSGSTTDLTTTKVILFEKATPVVINDGEQVEAEGYTISVAVEDTDTASVTIDGVTESHDEGWSGKIGGVDVYFKNVVGPNVAGTSRYLELYLNSNKLTLENAEEVVLGSTDLDGTNVTLTTSGGKVSEIKVDVTPKDFDTAVKYLQQGESFTDPVFGTVKFNAASINPELEATSRDHIVIKPSGEKKASIAFTNKAGKRYDMDMIRNSSVILNETYLGANATGDLQGSATYYATELGVGADYDLISTTTGSVNESDYFITCSNEYSQVWRLKNIKTGSTNELKLEDQGAGSSSVTVSLTSSGSGWTGTLTLADASTATLSLENGNKSINVSSACAYLYTEKGAKIDLAYADANSDTNGAISPTNNNDSEIRIVEETPYNGGAFTDNSGATLGSGKNVTIRLGYTIAGRTGKDMHIRDVLAGNDGMTVDTDYWEDDVGDYDYYYLTKYGSFVKRTGDTDKQVEVWYPEDAMSIGFYVGEVASEITPGAPGVAGGQVSIVKDSEVATVADKNLIVIGGSCVNTVAAKILGSSTPLCGEAFSAATNVGAGGYIIKTVASPENEAKIAMLVAGYNAADTTNAVKRAMVIDGVSTAVGSEEIYPVVA